MAREGQTFEEALKKAQELGYAERNPEADVEGYDTCRKITILTSLATGKEVNYEDVPVSYTHLDVYKRQALFSGCL